MKIITAFLAAVLPIFVLFGCSGGGGGGTDNGPQSVKLVGAIKLPKTGQSVSYATGDDGALQIGVAWPNPRFTDNGDQTVTDNLTGLMWTKESNAPGPISCVTGTTMTWQKSLDYVACLNTNDYLGYSDWRIPNRNELKSLINLGQPSTAAWLNALGFNVMETSYWSSTTYAQDTTYASVVWMKDGDVYSIFKTATDIIHAWPVRTSSMINVPAMIPQTGQTISYAAGDDGALQEGVAWPNPRFTNSDGTTPINDSIVVDQLTGLMWTQNGNSPGPAACSPGTTKSQWSNALDHIACLNLNTYLGYADWRLPNVNELQSLINVNQSDSAAWLNTQGFINAQSHQWSSTVYAANPIYVWPTYISNGFLGDASKTVDFYVWPVRGGQ
jgi:hypothetical protein